jgi:hypothetical protein
MNLGPGHQMKRSCFLLLLGMFSAIVVFDGRAQSQPANGPATDLHYAPAGNFDSAGGYLPGATGFNLADVSSPALMPYLPDGVKALVFLGLCDGANAEFIDRVTKFLAYRAKVFGFYLMDEPDSTGRHSPPCTAENLKEESDWIHLHLAEAKTFFVLMSRGPSTAPDFTGTYTAADTHVDLFGIDPYPCRTDIDGCDFGMIKSYVDAAIRWGIPTDRIVPVYQTFGAGGWRNDGGGKYVLPNQSEMEHMLLIWNGLAPHPVFDYAYSWGSQSSDQSLMGSAVLQKVFAAHNGR